MNENVLNKEQLKDIKTCGQYLSETLEIVSKSVKAGIATKELDIIAEEELRKRGCTPSFLDYFVEGCGRYPATLCVSINEEIVHGIPSHHRSIKDGDVVSLDIGAEYHGIHTDMAVTIVAGKSDPEKDHLVLVAKEALIRGIEQAKAGNTIGNIGYAIETYVAKNDLEVIRDYVGHGIGTKPHVWPQIPNFGKPGSGPKIIEGMALAIEPMVTSGDASTAVHSDNWTVRTRSGSYAAHFEHTVIIEDGKPVVVTKDRY